jgi:hypothetical protein
MYNIHSGFEVFTAVAVKSSILSDITPYSSLEANRHFGGICSLHFQGRRISQARKQVASNGLHDDDNLTWTTRRYIGEDGTLHITINIVMNRIRSSRDCPEPVACFITHVVLCLLFGTVEDVEEVIFSSETSLIFLESN